MTDITLVYWYAPAVAVLVVLLVVFVAIPRSQRRLEQARRAAYTRHIDLLGDATGDEEDEALRESLNGDDIAEPEFELTTEQIAVEPRDFLDPDLFDPKTTVGVAEVLSLKGHSNSQVPLFLIVPGNPGLVGFYRLFMHHLNRLGRGRVEFRCVSYVGHTESYLNSGSTFSFQFQIAFFRAYMKRLVARQPGRPIFLSGHSVGAYVCLQMLDALPRATATAVVPQTFMLCPTVFDIGATPNGRVHTPVLKYLRPFGLLSIWLLSLLPKSLSDWLIYLNVGLHPYETEAARSVLQVHTAKNCMYMALHEMLEIGPLQEDLIRYHLPSLYWVWSPTDRWSPLSQLSTLQSLFGSDLRYTVTDSTVPHAFVVGSAHKVAAIIYEQLTQFI